MTVQRNDDFAFRLLRWYDAHARDLPWRIPPGNDAVPDPYRVWLAEVMLQQTTVAAVTGYWQRFTARWPTVFDLAAADDAEVMAAWAGLGYYARARNLLACARAVVARHGGRFPEDESVLRELPGIGDYTAAAVAAIAFGRGAVVVDANIERVMARQAAIDEPLPKAKAAIRAALAPLVPLSRPGDFAQALMDLGATICTVGAPRCADCPLAKDCKAKAAGIAETLPVKLAKKAKPQRHGTAWWIEGDGAIWLERRADKGMLGGMRGLPGDNWRAVSGADDAAVRVRHSFTHFDLELAVVRRPEPPLGAEGEWWPLNALDAAGLPTLYRKAVDAMRKEEE
ncbi:MAG: A/G-specific adenine glycosylase [Sphingopyxis sp.]|nr:A/G-specific adenine glycosylase [Sphingopyxis sp.]